MTASYIVIATMPQLYLYVTMICFFVFFLFDCMILFSSGFNRQLRYRSDRVNRRAWAVFTHYAPSTW